MADGTEGIKRVDPDNGTVSVLSAGGDLILPIGVTVAPNGNIYVADFSAFAGQPSRIVRIDPATGMQSVVSAGGYLLGPVGIAIDNDGMIVVSDAATFAGGQFDLVLRIDPPTGTQIVVATNDLLGLPTGLALASGRRVLVANNVTGTIVQIDPATGEQVLFASGGYLAGPFGIAVVHKLELRAPTVLSDGRFKCLVFGEPGQVYLVEYTTDFNTWFAAGAITSVTELVEFIDPTALGHPYRFYRARPQ